VNFRLGCGSVQGPELKPHYHQKERKEGEGREGGKEKKRKSKWGTSVWRVVCTTSTPEVGGRPQGTNKNKTPSTIITLKKKKQSQLFSAWGGGLPRGKPWGRGLEANT
jgi:hypothetical protein